SYERAVVQVPQPDIVVFTARRQPLCLGVEPDPPHGSSAVLEFGFASRAPQIPKADRPVIRSGGEAAAVRGELDATYRPLTGRKLMENGLLLQIPNPHQSVGAGDGQKRTRAVEAQAPHQHRWAGAGDRVAEYESFVACRPEKHRTVIGSRREPFIVDA